MDFAVGSRRDGGERDDLRRSLGGGRGRWSRGLCGRRGRWSGRGLCGTRGLSGRRGRWRRRNGGRRALPRDGQALSLLSTGKLKDVRRN